MAGYKDFQNQQILDETDLDGYLMTQCVMRFASEGDRNTALASVVADGMVTYTEDTDTLWLRAAGAWVPVGEDHPALVVRKNATQTLTNNATTTISFDTIDHNTGFTFVAPGTTITIPKNGRYLIIASLAVLNSGTTGFMQVSAASAALARIPFQAFGPTDITGSIEVGFLAGNTVTMSCFHNNGADRTSNGGATHQTALSLRRVARF